MRNLKLLAVITAVGLTLVTTSQSGEIHEAATAGDTAQVTNLLSDDPGLREAADDKGRTPLGVASRAGQLEIVRLLLDAGADIDPVDSSGYTPLFLAVYQGHVDVVDLLSENGADINFEHARFGRAVDLAFMRECQQGESGMTDLLRSRGVEFDPNHVGALGLSHLHLAIHFGRVELVKSLIELGVDVNAAESRRGRTPVANAASRGRSEIVKLLLAGGADATTPDNDGNTPLKLAVESGRLSTVKDLLDAGATIEFVDKLTGRSLLHLAAMKGYTEIAELLIGTDCEVDPKDNNSTTPYQYACRYGHVRLGDMLFERGAAVYSGGSGGPMSVTDMASTLKPGEAAIWFLNNRGWAIRTESRLFLIDYEEFGQVHPTEPSLANGFVTLEEIQDQNVVAIYSCFHADPGELSLVHRLEDSLTDVVYCHNSDDRWRGCKNTVYFEPNQVAVFGDLKIRAVRPTSAEYMATRAYLIEVDGLVIYYAGFATDDMTAFGECLDSLAVHTDRVDIAFLPIPEPGDEDSSDFKAFVERFKPNSIVPQDPGRRVHLYPALSSLIAGGGLDSEVISVENPGDHSVFGRD